MSSNAGGLPAGAHDFEHRDWLFSIVRLIGNPYAEAFVMGLIGNFAIFFPVPYLVVIFTIALGSFGAGTVALAFFGALGAALGKFVSYGIGYGGRLGLGEKYRGRFDSMRRLAGKNAFAAAFLFAALPLPDDVVFIPLGMMRYSPLKTFVACFTGKFVLTLFVVWSARFSRETLSWIIGPENMLVISISIVSVLAITVVMIRVDWGKMLAKRAPR